MRGPDYVIVMELLVKDVSALSKGTTLVLTLCVAALPSQLFDLVAVTKHGLSVPPPTTIRTHSHPSMVTR